MSGEINVGFWFSMTGDATHDFVVDFGLDLVTKRVR